MLDFQEVWKFPVIFADLPELDLLLAFAIFQLSLFQ